jgi:hypothetical protein
MSAFGQKRTKRLVWAMSALPPRVDIRRCQWNVCYGPKALDADRVANAIEFTRFPPSGNIAATMKACWCVPPISLANSAIHVSGIADRTYSPRTNARTKSPLHHRHRAQNHNHISSGRARHRLPCAPISRFCRPPRQKND